MTNLRTVHRPPSLQPPIEIEHWPPPQRHPSWSMILINMFGSLLAGMAGAGLVIALAFLAAGSVR
jgi:hypothetical protein